MPLHLAQHLTQTKKFRKMTTKEIATQLVDLCRKGDYETIYKNLYSPDCVSIEPKGAPMEVCEGMESMMAKGKAWNESMEQYHGSSVGDPIIAGNHFSMTMMIDGTFKDRGRVKTEEICVYETKDGKIIKEQFFYQM